MKPRFILLLTVIVSMFIVSACQRTESKTAASVNTQRYELTGTIVSIDRQKRTAKIEHQEIKGYMPAMTMDFPIKDEWVLRELEPGDKVAAELIVDKGNYWLENVGIMKAPRDQATGNITPPTETGGEEVGAEVPNFALINQDGKSINFNDFRGKNLLVTFIFTRCPDANMCPLMSINFSDLTKQIENTPLAENTRLLSVTFDPQHDTPEVLRKYATGYLGNNAKPNFKIWQLATGSEQEIKNVTDFFGVTAMKADGENIVHNLRTALVAPDGKIVKIYAKNDWKPADIVRDLQNQQAKV